MLKYVNTQVTFAEVPDEITLCINISNCPCHCKGCHSAYLAEDIGHLLTHAQIDSQIIIHRGITCVCFMGGDAEPNKVDFWAKYIKEKYPNLKVAWYSGREKVSEDIDLWNFDYIKIGPYREECGPLNSDTTNQSFFEVVTVPPEETETGLEERWLINITDKFWKKNN